MGRRRRRIIVSPEAMLELVEIASVRRSEWRQMVLMITEHPEIGRKVGELDLGVAVRRMVLVKSKVLVY